MASGPAAATALTTDMAGTLAAALRVPAEGLEVAYLRSAFVPEDEVCLHWFIAPSSATVTELGRLAKLEFDRVIEELEQPTEEPCAPEPA